MLPQLQPFLDTADLRSFDQLELMARKLERQFAVSKELKAPPPSNLALLPEFSYTENRKPVNNFRPREPFIRARLAQLSVTPTELVEDALSEIGSGEDGQDSEELANLHTQRPKRPQARYDRPSAQKPGLHVLSESSPSRCFNCGGSDGHFAKNCQSPRRVYCKDCGKFGVTRNNCPVCPVRGENSYCSKCGRTSVTSETCPSCKKSAENSLRG